MNADGLVTTDNLTQDLLRSLYDGAFLETSLDDDGDLRVKDRISCWVMPSERKDRIKLLANFGFEKKATEIQRLTLVNAINAEYVVVRAVVAPLNDVLRIDYDILVEGGVTARAIVMGTKRFMAIAIEAIKEYGGDLVE